MHESRSLGRNAALLALGQALTSTVVALLTTVAGVSGLALAPATALATVPAATTVAGTLVMIFPAGMLMERIGRRWGFAAKSMLGGVAGALCAGAMWARSFGVLLAGSFLFGMFAAFGQYFRFAAMETSEQPSRQVAALSLVTAGGAVGGVAGPYVASRAGVVLPGLPPYAAAFVCAALLCIVLAVSQVALSADLGRRLSTPAQVDPPARRLQQGFLRASVVCAASYGVMTLTMVAAPLSMAGCGLGDATSATVLQVHFAAMYLPSLALGWLVRVLGLRGIVLAGAAVSTGCCLMTLLPAQTATVYLGELAMSGLGWNLMFNGGTLMLRNTYPANASAFAQGINSLIVYGANVGAALLAGAGLAFYGWAPLNLLGLPLLIAVCAAARRQRTHRTYDA